MYTQTTILGYLGNTPVLRTTTNGAKVANFSLATSRKWTRADGVQVVETTWFQVQCWGRLAENVTRYLTRGSQVFVIGRLVPDPETGGPKVFNRRDGSPGAAYTVCADIIRFLSSKKDSKVGQNAEETTSDTMNETESEREPYYDDPDAIPF